MDFGMLPPEINSGRMYSGAGAGPMLAAASAWDGLAAELQTVGAAYESMIAELNNGWSGPSATAMAAAATPYAQWMHTASAQAEQTANQARTAAAAYETAFAMTVPPPVVAANRALLMTLLATNFLGQNTPAIATTEAHYAQMWAQDAAAMYNYAGSSAAAAQLTPFTEPPQTINPSAASAPTAAALLTALAPTAVVAPAVELSLAGTELAADTIGSFGIDVLGTFLIDALGAAVIGEEILPLAGLANSVSPVAASLGGAVALSGLSVPPAWTVAAKSVIDQSGRPLPAVAPAVAAGETAIPIAGMAAAGLAGRATAAVGRGSGDRAGTTTRRRPPPQQPEEPKQTVYGLLMGIDIELRELAELRAATILTAEEYTRQKRRLLGR
jgi:uncharacterized protein YukE